jgi:hypothetical protein
MGPCSGWGWGMIIKAGWNERMCEETVFSMLTMVCDLKRIRYRLSAITAGRYGSFADCRMKVRH